MTQHHPSSNGGQASTLPRREYVPPKLERLGTIRDLTQGLGMQGNNDNEHPPGQNKSVI